MKDKSSPAFKVEGKLREYDSLPKTSELVVEKKHENENLEA